MYTSRLLFLFLFVCILGYAQTTYKIDEKYIYSWNDVSSDWQHDVTQQYTYENGGNKETKVVMLGIPGMVNLFQNIKTYNDNNDIILDYRQFWNAGESAWYHNSAIEYNYDGSNNLTEETNYLFNWITLGFDNFSRELYEYIGGNRTKQTSQIWNGTIWENDEKLDITYENGLPKQVEYSSWNSTTSMWEPYERDTATYNASDLPTEILEETYNMGVWEDSGKTIYTYVNGLQTVSLSQVWVDPLWVDEDRELTDYDENDNPDELIFESWEDPLWVGYYKEDRIFSPAAPLSTESFSGNNFRAFPNPVSDLLNMKFNIPLSNVAIAEVYSVDGRLVKSQNINTGVEISTIGLQNLVGGIYLLQIKDNNDKKTIRLIKK